MQQDPRSLVSIVIPLFNEVDTILPLHDRIHSTFVQHNVPFETIFINDGSTDGSAKVLDQLFEEHPHVQVVHLRRNFGKAAALMAGFKQACGHRVVTMDADLQDLPEEIPVLLAELDKGYDLISGWKYPRRDRFFKRLSSKVFNFFTSVLSGVRLHDMNCGFKAYSHEVVANLNLYGELHRYIPVIAQHQGFHIGEVKIKHDPRRFGRSKYGLWRFFSGFFDLFTVLMLTRFGARPLHIFGMIGLLVSLLGGTITLVMVVQRLLGTFLSNRPLFYFALSTLIVGMQVFFFGLLAEIIAHSRGASSFYSIRAIRRHSSSLRQQDDQP
jgi:glycosyltransferase involved in cell wall biosynthesis